ncbi:MAG TPA: hypothetical protein VNT75_04745 [Symbiobacteriaceae bacterium]|nr:hypothetical protein [Symbiobacteriaceae bacterium]
MGIDLQAYQGLIRLALLMMTVAQCFVAVHAWNPSSRPLLRYGLPLFTAVMLVGFYYCWATVDFEISGWNGMPPRTYADYFASFRLFVYGYPLLLAIIPLAGWFRRR